MSEATLSAKILLNSQQFMSRVREVNSASRDVGETVDKLSDKTAGLGTAFGKMGEAAKAGFMAATAAATGFFAYVAKEAGDAKQILNDATRLNMDTTSLQAFAKAVGKVGIESDKAGHILKDVNDKIGDFIITGGGEAKDIFEKLGLSAQEFIGKSPEEALLKIGAAIDGLTVQDKTFLLESLADDASLLIPLLENGGAKLKELKSNAIQKGQVLSEYELKALNDFKTALDDIWGRLSAFGSHLAGYMAEPLKVLLDEINAVIDGMGGMDMAALKFAKSMVDGLNIVIQAATDLYVLFQELKIAAIDVKGYWAMFTTLKKSDLDARMAQIEVDRTNAMSNISNARDNARKFETDLMTKLNVAIDNAAKNAEMARANGYAATKPREDTTRSMNEWIKKAQDDNAKLSKEASDKQKDAADKMREAAQLLKESNKLGAEDPTKARELFDKAIALQESAKALQDSAAELREKMTEIKTPAEIAKAEERSNQSNSVEEFYAKFSNVQAKQVEAQTQQIQAQAQNTAAFQAATDTFKNAVELNNAVATQQKQNQAVAAKSISVVFSGSLNVNLTGANDTLVKDITNNQVFVKAVQDQIANGVDKWLIDIAKRVL